MICSRVVALWQIWVGKLDHAMPGGKFDYPEKNQENSQSIFVVERLNVPSPEGVLKEFRYRRVSEGG